MPVLHLLAGPNGSGKSTFVERLLGPVTHLPFVNADVIAAERWPRAQAAHAYDASRAAAEERTHLMVAGRSFITETVFSHPSKLDLVGDAIARGYLVHLHVMLVPVEVSVRRVAERVREGATPSPKRRSAIATHGCGPSSPRRGRSPIARSSSTTAPHSVRSAASVPTSTASPSETRTGRPGLRPP